MVDPISTTAAVISIAMFGVSEGLGIYNGSGTCASCIQLVYSGFLFLKGMMSQSSHNPQPPTGHELPSAIPTTTPPLEGQDLFSSSKKPLTSVWGVI